MLETFVAKALALTKARLGITSNVRDELIQAIIDAIIVELQNEKGLSLDWDSPNHLMFVADYATWRYQSVTLVNPTGTLEMPSHILLRLHGLMLSAYRSDGNV